MHADSRNMYTEINFFTKVIYICDVTVFMPRNIIFKNTVFFCLNVDF